MCDGGHFWQSGWDNGFYAQYLEQHAEMMRWIQNLHNPTPSMPFHACSHNAHHELPPSVPFHAYTHNVHHEPPQYNQVHNHASHLWSNTDRNPGISDQRYRAFEISRQEGIQEEEYVENEDYNEEEEEEDSDDGLVFNMEALLALKAARDAEKAEKGDVDQEEEESFEVIESSEEEFDYVELNTFGQLDKKRGKIPQPNMRRDIENEKEMRKYLYGDRADTIAGLETSMAISFERLCDIHQPHLWPVLPLLFGLE